MKVNLHCLADCRFVGEISADGDGSEEKSAGTPLRGGYTSDLSEQIHPARHPRYRGHPWLWHETRNGVFAVGVSIARVHVRSIGYSQYNPPQVGYADTSSDTAQAIHMHPDPAISQHHTAAADPPAVKG